MNLGGIALENVKEERSKERAHTFEQKRMMEHYELF